MQSLSANLKTRGRVLFSAVWLSVSIAIAAAQTGAAPKSEGILSSSPPSSDPTETMQFSDIPSFAVAGVTDWTAAGGHGSDTILRTSEALTREALTLKPEGAAPLGTGDTKQTEAALREALMQAPGSFEANHRLGEYYLRHSEFQQSISLLETSYRIHPENYENEHDLALAYRETRNFTQAKVHVVKMLAHFDNSDLHRLSGEIDEQLGDPLSAVREYELAVRLDPSEQNYFEWGSELLVHRAVWQAQEVFAKGAKTHPKSERILMAWGAALFASGVYDQSALRVCDASDLNPADLEPYIFLGKIEKSSPAPLDCVEPKLARLLRDHPDSASANYYYAMAIWKRQAQSATIQALQPVETLLTKAVTLDPKYGEAHLQLGALYASQHSYDKAIGCYTKALEADPQLGEAHYRLGVAYDRTGELAKAKQEFELHNEIDKRQAAVTEDERREVKQFTVVPRGPG